MRQLLPIGTSDYLERATADTDRAERATLFEDLAVWRAGDDIRAHFARYRF